MKTKCTLAMIMALYSLTFTLNAQIFYQDIIPDIIINTWNMKDIHIDSPVTSVLNYGDPGNLTIWQEFGSQIVINAFSDCQVLFIGTYPAALSFGQPIASTGSWQKPSYSVLNNGTQGNWIGVSDHFLGVKVKSGVNWLYGWIRLDVNLAGTSVTIKDYACNRTPNAPMDAGQMVIGINQSTVNGNNTISCYPNPFNNCATIHLDDYLQGVTLEIYNSMGKKVKEITNAQGSELKIHRDNLPDGIYFLQLNKDQRNTTFCKLVIDDQAP